MNNLGQLIEVAALHMQSPSQVPLKQQQVDLDVHTYSYIARRGFTSFHHKLDSVVFENAFVIQGNR